MRAAILSIGDELTLGQSIDTNSAWLAAQLAERSIITTEHRTVPDHREATACAIKNLASAHDVLLITGGLGPTVDDLTREALGDVFSAGEDLVFDEVALDTIRAAFARRGRQMPEINRKQAMRPSKMKFLPNAHGTAPGLLGRLGRCVIAALPGPPHEMQPMFINHVVSELPAPGGEVTRTASIHSFGLGESDAAMRLGDLMRRDRDPLIGITVSQGIVTARIRTTGSLHSTQTKLELAREQIQRAWDPYAFGEGDLTLSHAVGELLRQHCRTLSTAESCTGGWLGKAIVDVAGSSDYYIGGWNTYSNQLKQSQLKVSAATLVQYGAVSQQVAEAMARGALISSGTTDSLAITGIAGPARKDQPTDKPVGTVFISLARRMEGSIVVATRHFVFPGDRLSVRDRAVKAALQMLRFELLQQPRDLPILWEAPLSFSEPDALPEIINASIPE